jgi:hypothetical protein
LQGRGDAEANLDRPAIGWHRVALHQHAIGAGHGDEHGIASQDAHDLLIRFPHLAAPGKGSLAFFAVDPECEARNHATRWQRNLRARLAFPGEDVLELESPLHVGPAGIGVGLPSIRDCASDSPFNRPPTFCPPCSVSREVVDETPRPRAKGALGRRDRVEGPAGDA